MGMVSREKEERVTLKARDAMGTQMSSLFDSLLIYYKIFPPS